MKKLFFLIFTILGIGYAQTYSFMHDGNPRSYIVHLPTGYNPSNSYPLVLNFHGYTSNASQQQAYSLMDGVADTAGFIVVYPNGIGNAWNVGFGASPYNSGVDDVGFVNALLDIMIANFSIDQEAVYSTGMSNGGYMSNRLACELPFRIVAIASVTGPMTDSTYAYCNPFRKVPVMHIHGTDDPIVNYNGMAQSLSVNELIDFWNLHDVCPGSSNDIPYPNINLSDSCTAIRHEYLPCADDAEVVLIEVVGGGHTWPGGVIDLPSYGHTNRDFFASGEIWNFFNKFRLNQFIGIDENVSDKYKLYPNPTDGLVYLGMDINYKISSVSGKIVKESVTNSGYADLTELSTGMYYITLYSGNTIISRKILKN